MAKIAHVAEKETYDAGQYIVREKSVGDTFYIIVRGSCDVFQLQSNNTQKLINKLKAGEHFGEKALLNDNDLRNDIQSNLILRSPRVSGRWVHDRTITVESATDPMILKINIFKELQLCKHQRMFNVLP